MDAFEVKMLEVEKILTEIEVSGRIAALLIRTFPLMGLYISADM